MCLFKVAQTRTEREKRAVYVWSVSMQFNYYKLWFLLWCAFLIPVQLLMIQCVSCSSYSRSELCCPEMNLKRMSLAFLIPCLAGGCKIQSTTDLPETFKSFFVLFLLDYEIAWSLSLFYCKRPMDKLAAWEWPLHPERGMNSRTNMVVFSSINL